MTVDTLVDPFVWRPDRPGPQVDGALAGLRLAVKDLFDVAGVVTTAGNPDWARTHAIPDTTAPVVAELLAAGARLEGKTLTDELAYSLNGHNSHFGPLLNPRAAERLVGGSSSGSAVAVAAGLADIGLGSDTGGSIRVPASYTGLFGLRPSHGLVSTAGMVALAPAFDTVGWMTRDLETLARVAALLLPGASTAPQEWRWADELFAPTACGGQAERWRQQYLPQARKLGSLLPGVLLADASAAFRVLQGRQIWATHGAWLTATKPLVAPDIQARLDWCATLSAADEAAAQEQRQRIRQQILPLVAGGLIVLPTTPGAAPLVTSSGAFLADYRNQLLGLTAIAGLCGLPQLHLPLFSVDGAPAGLSVLGGHAQERALLAAVAALLEAADGESGR